MNKPFFLTRQTANLMDDLVRELKAETGLYLIYGDSGVGKTQLLEELVQTRLAESKIRWMDLQGGSSDAGALVDSSVMIEETFARAKPGDIIVADHFEMALKKTRHQLFLSWSTDGVDKKLNLIVASNINYFNDLRQLAQKYQVRIESFQLMPFSADEASAFLASYLFPDRSGVKLSIPPLLRNKLATAQGSVGKIVEIAERAGDQMTSETAPETEPEPERHSSRIPAAVMVALAIIVGVGWYLIDGQSGMIAKIFAEPDSPQISQVTSVPTVPPELATNKTTRISAVEAENASGTAEPLVGNSAVADTGGDNRMESVTAEVDRDAGELAVEAVPTPAPEPATQPASNSEAEIVIVASTTAVDEYSGSKSTATNSAQADEQNSDQSGGGVAPALPAEVEAEKIPAASVAPSSRLTVAGSDRLQRDIQASLEWIDGRADSVGTLQIMLLSQARFDENLYYAHIDRLARQGVDTSQVRILQTLTGNKKVFSVVYGEYQSRGAAGVAEADLPSLLQDASPVPRSVGSLKEEMRRLEGQN
ncbi:hypothetical protein ACFL3W_00745 [Pseudomonadota bacterium]